VVVVVDDDQVAELLMAGEGADLVADALFDVTVRDDRVDVVVERAVTQGRFRVEQAAFAPRRHRHAHGVAQSLAKRPCGGLDTDGVAVLWMARCEAAPPAEPLEVLQGQAVTGQVELDVEREAAVARGQHEAVTTGPVRVGRVVAQQPLEQQVRGRCQAHRGSGMTGAGLLYGVHGERADCVHGPLVQLVPGEGLVGIRTHETLQAPLGCMRAPVTRPQGRRPCLDLGAP
jgi:hypothetical protein